MNKQVELLKANFEDLQTIWKMQVEAFSELYEKYHDTETSPATEKIDKIIWRFNQPETTYYFITADGEKDGVIRVIDCKDGVTRGYIQYCIDCYENADCYNWVIEYKENGQPIGSISVVRLEEEIDCAEIGYCLSEKYWGKGIMPEAFGSVIGFLFREVGVNRIQATHDTNNPKSGRVMEKCGLQYEGTLRQAGKNNQGMPDGS